MTNMCMQIMCMQICASIQFHYINELNEIDLLICVMTNMCMEIKASPVGSWMLSFTIRLKQLSVLPVYWGRAHGSFDASTTSPKNSTRKSDLLEQESKELVKRRV